MTYIIADPDQRSGAELKRILDDNTAMFFAGSFTTLKATEASIRVAPPDMAFIRIGTPVLNAVRLAAMIRAQNPLSKIIFVGSEKEDAVEAFEYEADGFLLTPLSKKKLSQMLNHKLGTENEKRDHAE